jgi:hypothetical protein
LTKPLGREQFEKMRKVMIYSDGFMSVSNIGFNVCKPQFFPSLYIMTFLIFSNCSLHEESHDIQRWKELRFAYIETYIGNGHEKGEKHMKFPAV